METKIRCEKIVAVRCEHRDLEIIYANRQSERAAAQMQGAARRPKTLLKNGVVDLIRPNGCRHLTLGAEMIGSNLDVPGRTLHHESPRWNLTEPESLLNQRPNLVTAIVCIAASEHDQQRLRRKFMQIGFRDLSAHLNHNVRDNDADIFGRGSIWSADL